MSLPASVNIGLDIVRVTRLAQHADDMAFLRRIFTEDELVAIPDGTNRDERLAGRWAAKEAVAKALGCGFGADLTFRDVEILHGERGEPIVTLSEFAASRHGRPVITVSISHDGDYAAAIAAVYRR
ncbi:MAG: Holo-[acyl-carrier-protein] synthase [Calditrichaeota bacterium]|nr:Holo-[acyl-carrier-protein] synthase [Calditrichota bacterium]